MARLREMTHLLSRQESEILSPNSNSAVICRLTKNLDTSTRDDYSRTAIVGRFEVCCHIREQSIYLIILNGFV
jgi:hypothetical protein